MAWSLKAHVIAESAAGNTIVSSAIDTTGADLLVLVIADYGAVTASSISDSKGNSWVGRTPQDSAAFTRCTIFDCVAPTVGAGHTFTATGTGIYPAFCVQAWSGSGGAAPDQQNGNTAAAETIQPGSVTPSVNNELLMTGLGLSANLGVVAIDSSFVLGDNAAFVSSQSFGVAIASLVQAVAAPVNSTWSTGSAVNLTLASVIASYPPAGLAPVITSALTASGQVGVVFTTYQITATNTPTSFSATGLPAGLSVNTSTGAMTGTPTTAGVSNVTIGATNAQGTGTATLVITILPAAPVITSALAAIGTIGLGFTYTMTATHTPTSFGASGLPSGLTVNTGTGVISGTPTAVGVSSVTLSATNSGGTGTATLVITIHPASQAPRPGGLVLQPPPFRVPMLDANGQLAESWRRFFLSTQSLVSLILGGSLTVLQGSGARGWEAPDDEGEAWVIPGPPGAIGPLGAMGVAGIPGQDGMDGEDWIGGGVPSSFLANAFGHIITSSATGAQNNFAPGIFGPLTTVLLTGAAPAITGLASGSQGQIVVFKDTGTGIATFAHNSGASSAGNKLFNIITSAPTPVAPGGFIAYQYDGLQWQLIGHAQGSTLTWIPVDGSGAALPWTVNTALYFVTGIEVYVTFDLTFPINASGAGVVISGLPFAALLISALSEAYTNSNLVSLWCINFISSTSVSPVTTGAAQQLNSAFSTFRVIVSGTYLTS